MIEVPQSAVAPNDHFTIIVVALSTIFVALIPLVVAIFKQFGAVKQAQQDVAEVKHQVKNDHSTNLRDENDQRHAETTENQKANSRKLDLIVNSVNLLNSTVADIQIDVRELKGSDAQHTEQLAEIEKTQDRAKLKGRHA